MVVDSGFLTGLIALLASDMVTRPIIGRRNPVDIYFGPREYLLPCEFGRECPELIGNSGKNRRMLPGVISGDEYGDGSAESVPRYSDRYAFGNCLTCMIALPDRFHV